MISFCTSIDTITYFPASLLAFYATSEIHQLAFWYLFLFSYTTLGYINLLSHIFPWLSVPLGDTPPCFRGSLLVSYNTFGIRQLALLYLFLFPTTLPGYANLLPISFGFSKFVMDISLYPFSSL